MAADRLLSNPVLARALAGLGRLSAAVRTGRRLAEGAYWSRALAARGPGVSNDVRVNGPGTFTGVDQLRVGSNVHIGPDAFFRCEGGLSIGDNCHFSRRITIYTMNHNYEGERLPYDETQRLRPVSIGDNVWLGMGVTVLPGASIGDGAIVGAGAVVAGTVAAGQIVGAPIAMPLGERDTAHYESLLRRGAFGGPNGRPR